MLVTATAAAAAAAARSLNVIHLQSTTITVHQQITQQETNVNENQARKYAQNKTTSSARGKN